MGFVKFWSFGLLNVDVDREECCPDNRLLRVGVAPCVANLRILATAHPLAPAVIPAREDLMYGDAASRASQSTIAFQSPQGFFFSKKFLPKTSLPSPLHSRATHSRKYTDGVGSVTM